jgi:hypothetical protein
MPPREFPKYTYFDEEEQKMNDVCSQGHARMAGVHYFDWSRPASQKVPVEYYIPALALKEEKGALSPNQIEPAESLQPVPIDNPVPNLAPKEANGASSPNQKEITESSSGQEEESVAG